MTALRISPCVHLASLVYNLCKKGYLKSSHQGPENAPPLANASNEWVREQSERELWTGEGGKPPGQEADGPVLECRLSLAL
jgi:hypothetical protein